MTRAVLPAVHGDQHLSGGSDPIPGIEALGVSSGATVHVGSGVPSSGLGADGDLYIRTDGNVSTSIYLKASGAWSASAILGNGNVTTSLHGLVPTLDNNAGHYLSGTGAWTTPAASSISSFGIFGDGSYGSLTLTQTSAAPAWATKSGSGATTLFTLSRDVYATTLLFSNANGNFLVRTNGWRIFATVSITIDSGIVVHHDGGNAQGSPPTSGGATATANSIGNQSGGIGAGSNGVNGTASQAITTTLSAAMGAQYEAGNTLVVQGGAGGAATGGGTGTGTAGGRVSLQADGMPRDLVRMLTGFIPGSAVPAKYSGGAGGTGGNGSVATGGGGGGGGGVLGIYTPTLINNGTIRANGGNGGSGTATGAAGGGGGGGGGVVMIIYGASGSTFGTVQVNGGSGAAGVGAGAAAGANGLAGTIYTLTL